MFTKLWDDGAMSHLPLTQLFQLWCCALSLSVFSRMPSPAALPTSADLMSIWQQLLSSNPVSYMPHVLAAVHCLECWFNGPSQPARATDARIRTEALFER